MSRSETVSKVVDRKPWLGLASYQEADSQMFFGREHEALELLRLVRREVLTVLFGPSGTGKTSLLNAGLFPLLRESAYLPVAIRLDHSSDRPDYVGQIRVLIAKALQANPTRPIEVEALGPPQVPADQETLWEYLHRVVFWDWRNNPVTPVLVFDQFEEIFTLGWNRAATEEFLMTLADLVENYIPAAVRSRMESRREAMPFPHDQPKSKVVLSLREDFVWRLDGLRKPMPSVMHNRFSVARMNGEQALRAVQEPGRGIVEGPVAQQIVRFVAAANQTRAIADGEDVRLDTLQVDPALLSVVCRELNALRIEQEKDQITADLIEQAGTNILNDFYERSFGGLNAAVRVFVEDRLLTASGFRSTVPLEEAARGGIADGEIRTLVDRRLIRIEERLGIPHLELTHDLLTKVVQKSRAERQEREEREREKQQREAEERERAQQEERRRVELRRARRLLVIVSAAALICLLLGLSALVSYQRAVVARKSAEDATIKAKKAEKTANDLESLADESNKALSFALHMATDEERIAKENAAKNRQLLYVSRVGLACAAAEQENYALARDALSAFLPARAAANQKDPRGFPWYYCWRQAPAGPVLLPQHGDASAAAFSSDGKMIAVRDRDGVALWRLDSLKEPVRFDMGSGDVTALALSPDGSTLAIGSREGLKLWNISSRRELPPLEGDLSGVYALAFSPDGSLLAAGGRVRFWNLESRKELPLEGPPIQTQTLAGPTEGKTLAFSADGTNLAVCAGAAVKILDMRSRRERATLNTGPDPFQCASVAFSRNGLVAAAGSTSVVLWEVETGKLLATLVGHQNLVLSVAFSPDGNLLATGSADHTAKLWDVARRTELTTLNAGKGYVFSAAFSPDGKTLATAHPDETTALWDVRRWQERYPLKGHSSGVESVVFSPDGKRLASGSTDDTVKIWDPTLRKELDTIKGRSNYVFSIAFSPDGRKMATGGGNFAKVWDAESGDELASLQREDRKSQLFDVKSVAFSPDGKLLAVGDAWAVTLWDAGTWRELDSLPGKQLSGVHSIAFSPGGGILAAAGNGLRIWALGPRAEQRGMPNKITSLSALAFSPDGKILAAAALDHTVKLWDPQAAREIGELKGHSDYVNTVAFSPDGRTLASGSADTTIKLWDTSTWQEVLTLKPSSSWVKSVAFSPDGKMLASGGIGWDVRLWYAASESEVQSAQSGTPR